MTDRLRYLFNLFTPGQVATIGLLASILGFVWHISGVVTEANLTIQNEIGMEKQRAESAEAQINLRIDNTIATVVSNTTEIRNSLTEMKADIRALTAASTGRK